MDRNRRDSTVPDDDKLVRQCKRELPYVTAAFAKLVDRYKDKVNRKCLTLLGNAEDAQDICQEIFLKVYGNIGKFRMASSFSTWLYAITVNACLRELDKRKKSPWWQFAEDLDQLAEEDEEVLIVLNENRSEGELTATVEDVLQRVDPAAAEVLRLRFIDELDYESIARKLGIGLSATKMRLKRARQLFKRTYLEVCK